MDNKVLETLQASGYVYNYGKVNQANITYTLYEDSDEVKISNENNARLPYTAEQAKTLILASKDKNIEGTLLALGFVYENYSVCQVSVAYVLYKDSDKVEIFDGCDAYLPYTAEQAKTLILAQKDDNILGILQASGYAECLGYACQVNVAYVLYKDPDKIEFFSDDASEDVDIFNDCDAYLPYTAEQAKTLILAQKDNNILGTIQALGYVENQGPTCQANVAYVLYKNSDEVEIFNECAADLPYTAEQAKELILAQIAKE